MQLEANVVGDEEAMPVIVGLAVDAEKDVIKCDVRMKGMCTMSPAIGCVHVCMCACVHVSMCACVHVCMCACVHVCMCACVHVCMCACVHVCMCACVHVCMCA